MKFSQFGEIEWNVKAINVVEVMEAVEAVEGVEAAEVVEAGEAMEANNLKIAFRGRIPTYIFKQLL